MGFESEEKMIEYTKSHSAIFTAAVAFTSPIHNNIFSEKIAYKIRLKPDLYWMTEAKYPDRFSAIGPRNGGPCKYYARNWWTSRD